MLLKGPETKLNSYGLLIGKITASRPKRPASPHWLLFVQPDDPNHPPYRVAVNLQTTKSKHKPELQYQIVEFGRRPTPKGTALIKKLTALGISESFVVAESDPALPRLDFARGGFLNPKRFADLRPGVKTLETEFKKAVAETMKAKALVAVFGSGSPVDPQTGLAVPTGFTGIENIHMNQGTRNLINSKPHYLENDPDQDGGIIFLLPGGARGFFVKFASQTINTYEDGNPAETGIAEIDKVSPAIRNAIMPKTYPGRMAARRTRRTTVSSANATLPAVARMTPPPVAAAGGKTNPPASANAGGYVFADVNPADASGQYIPDVDDNTYKTPYVMTRSSGKTRGPVPTPHVYPTLELSDILGANPPGYVSNSSGKSIAFDLIGDSGAPSAQHFAEYESKVTDLITRDAAASPPAFLFHVGDVVYFYGEENYYYGQFYEPFKAYPAPIFAIPGNHDGITYNDSMISLDSFQKAFCAPTPARWIGSGGLLRTSMTQPGVYFTLNAPLVSIIGLYSNCGESFGWLNDDQLTFLYNELVRLKGLRKNGLPAVILAIHHFPRWFPDQKPIDPTSAAIDAACKKAGFWPDAVACGHAHLYQRVVRQDTGQDIPYVLTGAGGYAVTPGEEVGKSYMAKIASSGSRLGFKRFESGYVRATLTAPAKGDPTLRFEYRSVKPASNAPDDVCTINLNTNKLV